jgi:hypothetical protein
MEASSPSPATEAGSSREERPPCPPPAAKPPSRGLQIEAAGERIERGPAIPAAMVSSGGESLIPPLGTPSNPSGFIPREEASSGPVHHPPWASERRGSSPAISAARRHRRRTRPRQTAETSNYS